MLTCDSHTWDPELEEWVLDVPVAMDDRQYE